MLSSYSVILLVSEYQVAVVMESYDIYAILVLILFMLSVFFRENKTGCQTIRRGCRCV